MKHLIFIGLYCLTMQVYASDRKDNDELIQKIASLQAQIAEVEQSRVNAIGSRDDSRDPIDKQVYAQEVFIAHFRIQELQAEISALQLKSHN